MLFYQYSFYFSEFKWRLFFILLSFSICTLVGFFYTDALLFFMLKPLAKSLVSFSWNVHYFAPIDFFFLKCYISLFFGGFFCIPFFWVQCFFFFLSGIQQLEAFIFLVLIMSFFSFSFVTFFILFKIIFPNFWFFIAFFTSGSLIISHYFIAINLYLFFCFYFFFWIFFFCQTPLFWFLLIYKNFFKIDFFFNYREFFYIYGLICSTVFSTPDFFSQFFFFILFLCCFEFFLFCCCWFFNVSVFKKNYVFKK